MSPARLSVEEVAEMDMAFEGMWAPSPNKKQKMHQPEEDVDILDDLETLWETRWKSACQHNQAPFQDASYLDVAPLITSLLATNTTSTRAPAFTTAFLTTATALAANPRATANRLLNACALLRIARYSLAPNDKVYQHTHALQRHLHARAARLWQTDSPLEQVHLPHRHASQDAAHRDAPEPCRQLPALVRVPLETLLTGAACPAVVMVTSSDRMGCTVACEAVLARGWAPVVVECAAADEAASVCGSVLAWMGAMGFYDMERVVVLADGGAGLRVAAGQAGEKLVGVVALLAPEVAGEVVLETPAACPTLVVSERSRCVRNNGQWTPVKEQEEKEEEGQEEEREGEEQSERDLYAFGAAGAACVGRLQSSGMGQVYAWIGDLMAGREGGFFWTVIPAVAKLGGGAISGRRFERELTPPSPAVAEL